MDLLQCDYSNRGHLTKFSTNLTTTWGLTIIFLQIIQNEHNSVAFVMYLKLDYKDNLWETIVNLHDFYSLNLWRI